MALMRDEDEENLIALATILISRRSLRASVDREALVSVDAHVKAQELVLADVKELLDAKVAVVPGGDVDEEIPSSGSDIQTVSAKELCVARQVASDMPIDGWSWSYFLVPAAIGFIGTYAFMVARDATRLVNTARALPAAAISGAIEGFKALNDAAVRAGRGDVGIGNDQDNNPMSMVLQERVILPTLAIVDAIVRVDDTTLPVATVMQTVSVATDMLESVDAGQVVSGVPLEIGVAQYVSSTVGEPVSIATRHAQVDEVASTRAAPPTVVPLQDVILAGASDDSAPISSVRSRDDRSLVTLFWVPSQVRNRVVELSSESTARGLFIGTEEMPRVARVRGIARDITTEASVVNHVYSLERSITATQATLVHDRDSVAALVDSLRAIRPRQAARHDRGIDIAQVLLSLMPGSVSADLGGNDMLEIVGREGLLRSIASIGSSTDTFQEHVFRTSEQSMLNSGSTLEVRAIPLDERVLVSIIDAVENASHVVLIPIDQGTNVFTFRDVTIRGLTFTIDVEMLFSNVISHGSIVGWSSRYETTFASRRLIRVTMPTPGFGPLSFDGRLAALERDMHVMDDALTGSEMAVASARPLDWNPTNVSAHDVRLYGSLLASSFRSNLELVRERRAYLESGGERVSFGGLSRDMIVESSLEREGSIRHTTTRDTRTLIMTTVFDRAQVISLSRALTSDDVDGGARAWVSRQLLDAVGRVARTLPLSRREALLRDARAFVRDRQATSLERLLRNVK